MGERVTSAVTTERNIQFASGIAYSFYDTATLVSPKGEEFPDAKIAQMHLKIYQQTPHEKQGQIKSPESSRFAVLTHMYPGEYIDYLDSDIAPPAKRGLYKLYINDNYSNKETFLEFDEYLRRFYEEDYQNGWALGLSSIAHFFVSGQGVVQARCTLLDLEVSKDEALMQFNLIKKRNYIDPQHTFPTQGILVESSPKASHFYSKYFYPYEDSGKVVLSGHYGSALLLNREHQPPVVDNRNIGHHLRSFSEQDRWFPLPGYEPTEVSSLRITTSILKPHQPNSVSFT